MRTKPIVKSVKVAVDIQHAQGMAYQRKLWDNWWRKLIADTSANYSLQPQDNPHEVPER